MSDVPTKPSGYVLDRDLIISPDGCLLVGGAPMRAVRLRRTLTPEQLPPTLADALVQRGMAHPVMNPQDAVASHELTVIIPTLGRAELVTRLVRSLAGLSVIVVDDGTPDASELAGLNEMPGVRVIRHEHNRGPGAARNTGLVAATTPYVVFIDSDLMTDALTLCQLGAHLRDERVALVAPRVVAADRDEAKQTGSHIASGWLDSGWFGSGWLDRLTDQLCSLDMGPAPALVRAHSRVGWLPSACLVARRAALTPFADHHVAEDVDLIWRTLDAGHLVRYDPGFVVSHRSRDNLWDALRRKAFYGSGAPWLHERHPGRVAPAVLSRATVPLTCGMLLPGRAGWLLTALGTAYAFRQTRRVLPDAPGRNYVAAHLTVRTVRGCAEQLSDLALRHWWPVVCGASLAPHIFSRPLSSLISRGARRWMAASLVVHAVQHRGAAVPVLIAGVAYGAGVWRQAVRSRDLRCLLPSFL